MVVLHSFLWVYSLRTGATVSMILSLISLVVYLIIGLVDEKSREATLHPGPIILYFMWFCFTTLGFIGVYVEISTYIIPELSRRVLFIVLDIMGAIATYFQTEVEDMPVPEIGLQWYTIANAHPSFYHILVILFLLTIPIKLYLFIVMLSYYIHIKVDDIHHEGTSRTPSSADD